MAGDEPDDDEEEREKLEELKEREEEAQREAQRELEKQNKILEELINKNLVLIRKLYQAGRTPQLIDVVKIEAADMAKAKEQRLALQKIPKATVKWVKVARDKKTNDIDKVKRLIANAKKDGKSTLAMELQGDLDRFLNTTREFTPEGLPIVGTGKTKIKKKTKPVFDDTIDYVATALDLWMRCRNASKANPKKGPCGRMGKGKLKRMTQKEAMMAVEKLEKKLVKLS
jgi:vacuolar-type H+-ATPase subunit E/Vma4